jgi:hypothetical protein
MNDPQLEAMRLVNKFTLYGFIKDPETSDLMVSFAKFAAIQHISEITTPQTPVEQVVDHMKIIAAITNLEISYPL